MEFEKIRVGMGELEFEKRGEVCELPRRTTYTEEISGEEFIEMEIIPRIDEIKRAKTLRITDWQGMGSNDETLKVILEYMIEKEEIFSGIEEFQIGLEDEERIDLFDIIQTDYGRFLSTFEGIKKLVLGVGETSDGTLRFGEEIHHENLEEIEIISSKLDRKIVKSIAGGYLPSLKSLVLHLGYGGSPFKNFVIQREDIISLLESENLEGIEKLGFVTGQEYLGIVELLFEDGYIDKLENLKRLNLVNTCRSDEEGRVLLENSERVGRLEEINIKADKFSYDIQEELREKYKNINIDDETYYYSKDGELAHYETDKEEA